ncbi:MAG TPA: DUF47 family protein [Acidimicrobiia bacterium]|nr:DUF47 family protein [Acidimicrobiia bacterium]
MTSRFRRFLRDVLGRSDEATIAQVQEQLATVQAVVELVRAACNEGRDIAAAVDELDDEGRRQREALTRTLSSSLTTPIDREDLARLSRSIDDVLDNLRDFVREFDLYDAPDPDGFVAILDAIAESLAVLGRAIAALADGPEEIVEAARDAEQASGKIRRTFQDAIAILLEKPVDSETLRQRELLRRLDVVGLRLGEAANALGDGGLKRIS